jgi:uncharacterized protein (UPF0548 family)
MRSSRALGNVAHGDAGLIVIGEFHEFKRVFRHTDLWAGELGDGENSGTDAGELGDGREVYLQYGDAIYARKQGDRQNDYLQVHGSQVIVLSVTSFLVAFVAGALFCSRSTVRLGPFMDYSARCIERL